MNFGAVYHRMGSNYCYPLNEDELILNLKTGYEVEKVFLIYGDPFSAGILGGNEIWSGKREEIPYKKHLTYQIWWTTTVRPEFKRCRYYFELHTKDEVWFYFEDGFLNQSQMELSGRALQCFTFPWMNSGDINKTPEWVNKTVWYQIFPERFCNGNGDRNPWYVKPWTEGKVTNEDFYGGNLDGIYEKLEYLQNLGVTGLYLTPINESPSSHKYDTTDYTRIDPIFGDEVIFQKLVDKAHQLGIKIMLDGVFNHCGSNFKPWLDVVEKGAKSQYYSWFMVHEWPFLNNGTASKNKQYYSFAFADNMPKLNTNHKEVIDYFCNVCEDWVRKYDIDGLRLDVANEVSHGFVRALRKRMLSIKSDFYLLGEIWHDSIEWLNGNEFDAVMNYPLTGTITNFWLDKELTKLDFEAMINRCYTMYMQQNNDVLFNLLDSHDTERLITRVKNIDVFYQQLAVLFTMPGSPCIFYGTEIALEGNHDPDCRRCMPWDKINSGEFTEITDIIKRLIQLRKVESSFRSRNFHFPNEISEKRVIEYIKLDNKETLKVILNCSNQDIPLKVTENILFQHKYEDGILKKNGILIGRS